MDFRTAVIVSVFVIAVFLVIPMLFLLQFFSARAIMMSIMTPIAIAGGFIAYWKAYGDSLSEWGRECGMAVLVFLPALVIATFMAAGVQLSMEFALIMQGLVIDFDFLYGLEELLLWALLAILGWLLGVAVKAAIKSSELNELIWVLARHRCQLCRVIIRKKDQARWPLGLEYKYGWDALNPRDYNSNYEPTYERGPFCVKCCERIHALGAKRVETEKNVKRTYAIKMIAEWLPRISPLPKAVSEYKKDDGRFNTYHDGLDGNEFLEQIRFESLEELYDRLPKDSWLKKPGDVVAWKLVDDGVGLGQFFVRLSATVWRIDSHCLGLLWRRLNSYSQGG